MKGSSQAFKLCYLRVYNSLLYFAYEKDRTYRG